MNLYKNKSRYGSLNRIYYFDNNLNGSLGPVYFLDKLYKKPINKKKIFDLIIYLFINNNNEILNNLSNEIKGKNAVILFNKNNENYYSNNKIYITDEITKIDKNKDIYFIYKNKNDLEIILYYIFSFFYYKK
jgi:hypothetical protein